MDYKEKVIELLKSKVLSKEEKEKLADIFPELKESEDERIKKAIKKALQVRCDGSRIISDEPVTLEEAISWLEKKGEQNPTLPKWKYKKDNTPLLRDSLILNKYGCVAKSPSGALVSDVWVIDYDELAKLPKEEFEKQGQQKPADKVEPKFKIEEEKWYVCTQTYVLRGKIVVIKGQVYQARENGAIKGEDGCLFIDRHDGKASDYFRYWTIQDAKAGDVLLYREGQWIFIYKEIVTEDTFKYYALLSEKGITLNDAAFSLLSSCITPATKEQRNQLEKAMADAGYTFDFEKKELKKIEQLTTFEEAIKDMMNDYRDAIGDNDATIEEIKKHSEYLLSLIPQKPTWSEEDEKQRRQIERIVSNDGCTKKLQEQIHNWFESLKYRVQPQQKQEWSEDDDIMVENIRNSFGLHCGQMTEALKEQYDKFFNKVKSLRLQSHWKPSEEQMKALDEVIRNPYLSTDEYNGLIALREQLKAL